MRCEEFLQYASHVIPHRGVFDYLGQFCDRISLQTLWRKEDVYFLLYNVNVYVNNNRTMSQPGISLLFGPAVQYNKNAMRYAIVTNAVM